MLIYSADTGDLGYYYDYFKKLPKFNILTNFAFYENDMDKILNLSNNVLVDSGAFTFRKKGIKNLNQFVNNYIKFIEKYESNEKVKGFFELDIDTIIGYDKVLEIRNQLEEVSDKIIPVWHKNLGIQEFKKMCNEYDYVSLSSIGKDINEENAVKFVNTAHKNNAKIHALGLSKEPILNTIPFDSVDSTSWMRCCRFGNFKGKKIDINYTKNNRKKVIFLELLDEIKKQKKYYNRWKHYHND